ncbi:MAG: hypothetical protein LBV01_03350 [Deltaproteobacteria bacterium]|jgi:CheY-like chemotaxis protein|nr:hypothetical protein [Deltaproteobacteria bacterium]
MMPVNALLLAEDESCLALDRKVFRRFGLAQSLFFSSGRKALDHLVHLDRLSAEANAIAAQAVNGPALAPPAGMILCNERLGDMTGLQFLARLRSLPALAHIPAILLVGNGQSPTAIAARASNSCAVLARPYTPDQAEHALRTAALPEALHAPLVLPPSFSDRFGSGRETAAKSAPLLRRPAAPQPQNHGERALQEGLAALKRGDTARAESLLHGSYKADPGRVETCLALSRLYAALHKEREELMWLCRAAVLCLKRGEKTRALALIGRLPRGRAGQTPLLAEAGLVLQDGEAKAAALSFLEAHRLDPSQPLHALIGRTCMFTPAPEEHMRELVRALAEAGHDATAGKLHWRLLQPAKVEEEEHSGFLDRFPLLNDIVSVAAYTFKAWRHAA